MRQVAVDLHRTAQRAATLALAGAIGAAAAFVLRFNPTDRVADPTGPCLWHAVTGINGPGCGGTRMFYYMLHGDLVDAARRHLAALVAVPFLLYAGVRWAGIAWFGRELPALRLSPTRLLGLRRRLPALQHGPSQSAVAAVHVVRHPEPDPLIGACDPDPSRWHWHPTSLGMA
ncbi:uncharacterized protein DUF2752 [Micromonospora kangleipakensis]|uniref:Uncharacterized protein DUF2752 n=1 Tax=Micromonospora kangleipakensis TaxID=1077942 RepID=A0A4Q8BF36_9ACTN|nr:DUF2752 domain-containing protein [Micromonospora kangleipakensis]RZU76338.1 uncharacterized protein DUF2752 [Micromonospora kangleipakensis]